MFKVIVEQEKLIDGLRKIKSTIGKGKDDKNTTDKYVYMETYLDKVKKPMLKLISTNFTEISEVVIEAVNIEEGVAPLMEFVNLTDMINTITGITDIGLSIEDDVKLKITYKGKKKTIISLNGIPSEQFMFKSSPVTTSEIKMPCGTFKEGIDAASCIVIDDENLPMYNCVNVTIEKGVIDFEAIDPKSKRMIVYSSPTVHSGEGKFFVECNKIKRMIAGFDAKEMSILLSDNNIVFQQDNLKVTTRLLQGAFPNIKTLMPSNYKSEVVFNRDEMLTALKRAGIMLESLVGGKSIILDMDQGFLNINLNSKIGILKEFVVCSLLGEPVKMSFMVKGLTQVLSAFSAPSLKMCFYNDSSCIVVPEIAADYTHKMLITAVRTVVKV